MAARYLVGESSSLVSRSMLRTTSSGSSSSSEASAALLRQSAVARPASSAISQRRPFMLSAAARERFAAQGTQQNAISGNIGAYLLLSRLPTILPAPTPFEAAYYAYNVKLHRALEQPFPRELYYKKGSAAETQFLADEAERKAMIRGAWRTEGTGEEQESSDGEVRVPQPPQQQQQQGQEATWSDATLYSTGPNNVPYSFGIPVNGLQEQMIASRQTKADETNDVLSLERKLDRTLFLVVKGASAGPSWTLPNRRIPKDASLENQLHKVAPQTAYDLLGPNMDIWMVADTPVAVFAEKGAKPVTPTLSTESNYVMRAHILAGKAEPVKEDIEYAWLTREEMQERLDEDVWVGVEDLLST